MATHFRGTFALATLTIAAVLGSVASPAWAAANPGGAPSPAGGFALGDGLEGVVDEQRGDFAFELAAAGLGMRWDSRLIGMDEHGLGGGWQLAGIPRIEAKGGVRVHPASGGVFEADASSSSGLHGYLLADVSFDQVEGVLPARGDALAGERAYSYRLTELGGVVSYFDADGRPVVRLDARGARSDWVWGGSGELVRIVDGEGVVTEIDRSVSGQLTVTTQAGDGAAAGGVGRTIVSSVVSLQNERVSAVVGPTGARTTIDYDEQGAVIRVTGASGAATAVSWQPMNDGRPAVDTVTVLDQSTGQVVSSRRWESQGALASGWPGSDAVGQPGLHVGAEGARTVISDGVTSIVSEYSSRQQLMRREVEVVSPAGLVTVEEQSYSYPGVPDGASALPSHLMLPAEARIVRLDESGGERVLAERYEYDDFGRVIRHEAADTSVSVTEYDDTVPEGRDVPIGLALVERTETDDGLVAETRHAVNAERTDVVATESFSGRVGDEKLVRVARTEFDVRPDGFVAAERRFPQGGAGEPVRTERERTVDPQRGTVTVSVTVAAGTELATTTSTTTDLVHGQPTEVTDAAGLTSSAAYDAAGRPVTVRDANGNTAHTEYRTRQQHGVNAVIETGADKVTVTREQDVVGRLTRTTDSIDRGVHVDGHERVVETRSYPNASTVAVTNAWGATSTMTTDAFGREIAVEGPSGVVKATSYDDVAGTSTSGLTATGSLADAELISTEQTDVRGAVVATSGVRSDGVPVPSITATFDGLGRTTSIDGAGLSTRYELDAFGNPVSSTITETEWAAGGEPASSEAAAGVVDPVVVSRAFDPFGAGVEKTLTSGEHSRRGWRDERDILGRVVAEIDQDGAKTTHRYTADGLIEQTVTGSGTTIAYAYDEDTRSLIEHSTTASDGSTVRAALRSDPITGKLLEVFDPAAPDSTRIKYTYDAWGNLTAVAYPDGSRIEHDFDQHGRKIATTDVAGNTTTFAYNAAGLLESAVQTDESGVDLAAVRYDHDELGRVIELDRGNGVSSKLTYTSASEIETETTTDGAGRVLADRRYAYSASGDLIERTDRVLAVDGELESTTTSYRFDAHHRLIGSAVHDGADTEAPAERRTDYDVSVSGDVLAETVTERANDAAEPQVTTRRFDYTATGALIRIETTHPDGTRTTATQTYDEAGNLTQALDGTAYRYDAADRLVAETTPAGELVETSYWADGSRRALVATDSASGERASTTFHWDGATLLNDTHEAGGRAPTTASYLIGSARHARSVAVAAEAPAADAAAPAGGAETAYFLEDRHANITALTGTDGRVIARYGYRDYGAPEPAGSGGEERMLRVGDVSYQPFRFAGEYRNPTPAGTQHLSIREYDADTMRFTRVDPEGLHNRYAFGDLNPVTNIDPSGRNSISDTSRHWALGAMAVVFFAVSVAFAAGSLVAFGGAMSAGFKGITALTLGIGATADVAAVGTATLQLVDHFDPEFTVDPKWRPLVDAVEIGGAAVGGLAAVASAGLAWRASKLAGKRPAPDLVESPEEFLQRNHRAAAGGLGQAPPEDVSPLPTGQLVAQPPEWDLLDAITNDVGNYLIVRVKGKMSMQRDPQLAAALAQIASKPEGELLLKTIVKSADELATAWNDVATRRIRTPQTAALDYRLLKDRVGNVEAGMRALRNVFAKSKLPSEQLSLPKLSKKAETVLSEATFSLVERHLDFPWIYELMRKK